MKIQQKTCKTILSNSGIYDVDYSLNPYTGCSHRCKYCYATYMKKFTDHKEPWGEFVDIKKNAPRVLKKEIRKKPNGQILLSSVTDPYQPIEEKQEITRDLLKTLKDTFFSVNILTKSDLVTRDQDLFKEFLGDITIGLTINFLNERDRETWEPEASKIRDRINALKELKENDIDTYIHIGPYLPKITDLKEIIKETDPYVNEIQIENLNTRNKQKIMNTIKRNYPKQLKKYQEIITKDSERHNRELIKETEELSKKTDTEISVFID